MVTFYDHPEPGKHLKESKALSEYIRQEIAQKQFIPFARFMELALYHPTLGYYNLEKFTLGKEGDFTTAPEISPLFAQCFANQLIEIMNALSARNLLELGAGTGKFAQDVLQRLHQLNQLPDHYYIYEISPTLRKKQQALLSLTCPFFKRIQWLDTLPTQFHGVIVANEVLDALPFHCFHIAENTIKERCVTLKEDTFSWLLTEPTSEEFKRKVMELHKMYHLSVGYESEVNLLLPTFIQSLADSLDKGVILLADYGYGQSEYYRPERTMGTLSCFYQHRHHANPLIAPGQQDITAHVDFTSVIETAAENGCQLAGYTTQAAFLFATGLVELAHEMEENLSDIEKINLRQKIKTLTLPTEMGERIKIMALAKNSDLTLRGFQLEDRRRDL